MMHLGGEVEQGSQCQGGCNRKEEHITHICTAPGHTFKKGLETWWRIDRLSYLLSPEYRVQRDLP